VGEVALELGCRAGEDLGMPSVPRRPAAQRERDRLQARRLRAAELFAVGVRQAEVARQLGVSGRAVSVWHANWKEGGAKGLRSRAPSGPAPRLSDAQLVQVEQALVEAPRLRGLLGSCGPWSGSGW
jgi:transposase-like protein